MNALSPHDTPEARSAPRSDQSIRVCTSGYVKCSVESVPLEDFGQTPIHYSQSSWPPPYAQVVTPAKISEPEKERTGHLCLVVLPLE